MDDSLLPPSAFLPSSQNWKAYVATEPSIVMKVSSVVDNPHIKSIKSEDEKLSCKILGESDVNVLRDNELKSVNERLMRENEQLKSNYHTVLNELKLVRHYYESGNLLTNGTSGGARLTLSDFSNKHYSDADLAQLENTVVENSRLNKEVNALKIQLESLETVVKLQENQLCAKYLTDLHLADSDLSTSDKLHAVLNYWRNHVLRLLMEVEKLESESRHRSANWTSDRDQMQQDLALLRTNLEVVQLKLKNKETALDVEATRLEATQKTVEQLQQQLVSNNSYLTELQQWHNHTMSIIKQKLSSISDRLNPYIDNTFTSTAADESTCNSSTIGIPAVFQRLRQLERRLQFANSRLPLIRCHLRCKRYPQPVLCDQPTQTDYSLTSWSVDTLNSAEQMEILQHEQIKTTLAMHERDEALKQLEDYVKSFENRVKQSRQDVKEEIVHLQESKALLESRLDLKEKELDQYSSQLESSRYTLLEQKQEADDRCNSLQTRLQETESYLDRTLKELKRAEKRIAQEISDRKQQMCELENNYKSKIRNLEVLLHSSCPVMYPIQEEFQSIQPTTETMALTDTTADHAYINFVKQSLGEIQKLADCLKSDESDEQE